MTKLHFQKYLDRDTLENIRKQYGFRDILPLEKFIMDFEMLTHIQQVLPDCVVKGGMAVPFHLQDNKLRRLSVDIDIVTGRSKEDVINAMRKVAKKLSEEISIGDSHIPKVKEKELPLLTYYCQYRSSVADNAEMKIEIFYGNDMQIRSKEINADIDITGFIIDFPLSVYDCGSLIGDKLTTLPFRTIGLKPSRELDVPKQIYDIASLLKSVLGIFPIDDITDSFEKIANDEIKHCVKNLPSLQSVLADLDNFSDTLLITDNQMKLNRSYQGRFEQFKTEMLGKTKYPSYAHVTDILLIRVLVKLILKKFDSQIDAITISNKMSEILEKLKEILNYDAGEANRLVRQMRGKYGKGSDDEKIIKNMRVEQVYLYDCLLEIDKL